LKPGGQISITTPNFASKGHQIFGRDWFPLDAPRHLALFSPNSLRKALEALGFQTEPGIRLELLAKATFQRSMHVRYGNDPMSEKPPLPINARLRTLWLAQKANRAARTDPDLAESLIELAIRK
jgi:hypothetical protein